MDPIGQLSRGQQLPHVYTVEIKSASMVRLLWKFSKSLAGTTNVRMAPSVNFLFSVSLSPFLVHFRKWSEWPVSTVCCCIELQIKIFRCKKHVSYICQLKRNIVKRSIVYAKKVPSKILENNNQQLQLHIKRWLPFCLEK